MNQQTISKLAKVLLVLILVGSSGLSIYSAYRFEVGFHNVDLARNLNIINAAIQPYGLSFVDINSQSSIWTSNEMYAYGQNLMKDSFVIFGISELLMGGSLVGLIKWK